ncbi:MAG: glycosyltransferase family 39 protein [Candidatus Euphemobacter frigidus]|nr:glycosyltransferase family 39 protein [Candidatus Euphemobacter frigidus]MDP8276212.1 glycosyltransferase family 39 protein [Candidatus Euphemobacter frigidus]
MTQLNYKREKRVDTDRRVLFYLILIIVLAFMVRLIGLRFGFPYLLHADEPTAVKRALLFFRDGLNPHWFAMPSCYLYLLHFSYRLYYQISVLSGAEDILPHLWVVKTPFYLIGRLWSVLLGTATVYLVFLTGRKLYSSRAALGAAFLIAVLPLHLLHSHYSTVDVPVTFLIILSFFCSALLLNKRRLSYYLLAGVAAGVAGGDEV